MYGRHIIRYETSLTIFSLKTQQIEVRLVAIKSDYFPRTFPLSLFKYRQLLKSTDIKYIFSASNQPFILSKHFQKYILCTCYLYLINIRFLTRSSNISGQHLLVYKGTVDGTSSDPPFKDGICPIYNGNLETLI